MIGLRRWLAFTVLGRPAPTPRKIHRGPERIPEYRAFIREFPCACCGTCYGIEAAHTGPHGLGRKGSDKTCVPLCAEHHRTGKNSYHRLGPVKFEEAWRFDLHVIVTEFNRLWRQQ